jgi:hypothetical protein
MPKGAAFLAQGLITIVLKVKRKSLWLGHENLG